MRAARGRETGAAPRFYLIDGGIDIDAFEIDEDDWDLATETVVRGDSIETAGIAVSPSGDRGLITAIFDEGVIRDAMERR